MAQAPPTVYVQQQPVYVQQQPTVIVQQRPVVVVQPRSQAEEMFNAGIRDLNRVFAPTTTTYVATQPVLAANQVVAVCAHCRAQIVFTRVGAPVQVKCWNCPHANTFQ